MITEYDERVYVESEFMDEFLECIHPSLNYIKNHKNDYRGGKDRIRPKLVAEAFDELIQEYGFELDGKSLRHKYGIGNNNEWDIVDKDLVRVGDFFCTDDMFGGVITGVSVKGETIERYKLR